MKHWFRASADFFAICLALLAILPSNALYGDSSSVVRVVIWNLEWFPGKKPNPTQEQKGQHFLEVAAVVPRFHADVLILQEVRDYESVEKLAKLLPGFEVHVVSKFKEQVGGVVGLQQFAILSRFKADSAWTEPWKREWANAPRCYAYHLYLRNLARPVARVLKDIPGGDHFPVAVDASVLTSD